MNHSELSLQRRTFLGQSALGLGSVALASLLGKSAPAFASSSSSPVDPRLASPGLLNPLHHLPRAKRVIFLCMAGGPSHLELFDEKPALAKLDGAPMPTSYTEGQPIAQLQGKELLCWGPRAKFASHGQSGQRISSLLPAMSQHADELCILRSMKTEQINHDPAHTFMNTGTAISGRPSMGAWVTYGLGSEADNLPGFVVMTSRSGRPPQPVSSRQWHSGFLPSRFQGVPFHSTGEPVHYAANPPGVDFERQQDVVDTLGKLNRLHNAEANDPEIATRIAQYELAFRMQSSVPTLTDISDEPQHVLDAYGVSGADGTFAYNCLLARRLAERGVRFVQLYHRGWDHHDNLESYIKTSCDSVDKATGALLGDLKQRGLLEDTLVVWGGEFGRTPMAQKKDGAAKLGRDHHIKGFSMVLAGGGVKGGVTHGATDELGYNAVESVVHVHDLHATMLHLLGVDHKRLTYRYQGRDFRLTDVHGEVVKPILA
ncbi:hypothetical protein Pla108_19840 [Botrimarina colliarenosi]|uniref:Sulfatase n=1 Tax=Botrimarina colliarenosi TaxID=2528001 RepID=A0A5C6ACQ7_9BACT|nr:DUF1501 domain-containing protein [Botrimarina colliarenosi]TWT97832.1 hypothetical protein Pla108_19840 [Botrimarina colliarenosi]